MLDSSTTRAALAAALALAAAPAFAAMPTPAPASNAQLVIVHGLPGADVSATVNPLLPVDVLVNGKTCLLTDFTYGQIAGPVSLPAGSYAVAISLANPAKPCGSSAVISATLKLTAGSFTAAVAAVGTDGKPTADAFPVDTATIPKGQTRYVTAHAADAGTAKVKAVPFVQNAKAIKFTVDTGKANDSLLPTVPGVTLEAKADGAKFFPVEVQAPDRSLVLTFAVGKSSNKTGRLLSLTIPPAK